jgi:hypothetical protein
LKAAIRVLLALAAALSACRPSADALSDPALRTAFAQALESAVRQRDKAWLEEHTALSSSASRDRLLAQAGLPGSAQQRQNFLQGWVWWQDLYALYGHFDFLREYEDERGRHLIFRAFDGERPVYTDLLLGWQRGRMVMLDWTEQPGALSASTRAELLEGLALEHGPEALGEVVRTLGAATAQAEQGYPERALASFAELPQAWRSNRLVLADQLRIMADAGDPDFPQAALRQGILLPAPALTHLAFSWALRARDAVALQHASADMGEQFGQDSLLLLYEGLFAEWSGNCVRALNCYEAVAAHYSQNPALPAYSLHCLAETRPEEALRKLATIYPQTGLSPEQLDDWVSEALPALHQNKEYVRWMEGLNSAP